MESAFIPENQDKKMTSSIRKYPGKGVLLSILLGNQLVVHRISDDVDWDIYSCNRATTQQCHSRSWRIIFQNKKGPTIAMLSFDFVWDFFNYGNLRRIQRAVSVYGRVGLQRYKDTRTPGQQDTMIK